MKKIIFNLLLCILSFNASAQNWPSVSGNNQRNGLSSITGPSSVISSYWNVTSTNPTTIAENIYTYNDRFVNSRAQFAPVYIAKIECRNLQTGSLLWESPFISATSILLALGFDEHAVYAHDYDTDSVYALSPDDGSILWTCPVTSMSYAPMDGIFFTCERDLVMNGPDPFTSTMRVNRITGDTMWTNDNVISVTPSAVAAMNDSTMYRIDGTITTPKRLYAIDINTGATKYYSADIPGDGDQENPLCIGPDGTIYFLRDGGLIYAFRDNGSGFTQLWGYSPVNLPFGFTTLSVDNSGNVLMLDNDKLIRLHRSTGAVMDSSLITFPQARITVGADSTVYINDENGMYYALSHDLQTVKWSLTVPGNSYAGPVLAKDGIFIICGAGTTITAYKDSVTIAPVADFSADTTWVTTGDSIELNDQSSFSPTAWLWIFPGGTPATASTQNAFVSYALPGTYEVTLIVSNSSGSDTLTRKCYIEVDAATNIVVPGYGELVTVGPNPANEQLAIRNAAGSELTCFDSMGRLVMTKKITADAETIGVQQWQPGLYLLTFSNAGGFQAIRIVVSR